MDYDVEHLFICCSKLIVLKCIGICKLRKEEINTLWGNLLRNYNINVHVSYIFSKMSVFGQVKSYVTL